MEDPLGCDVYVWLGHVCLCVFVCEWILSVCVCVWFLNVSVCVSVSVVCGWVGEGECV